MNYVYILKCADNSLYTGWTNDLKKRFKEHSEGRGAKYTKGRGPLELVYFETFDDKCEAMKREWSIKQLTRTKKDKIIESFSNTLDNNQIDCIIKKNSKIE